jgi:predicted GNAT superfamily acetyltransferase
MPEQPSVSIRPCRSHAEFSRCVELQREVWQFADLEIVAPDLFVVFTRTGGQVFGAWRDDQMIGFSLAAPAIREGKAYLHSHMVAVLPEWQNRGVGRLLKLAQREEALSRGINLIEWTFDPLEVRNAYFNIAKLGVIVRRYEPDFYGITTSPLHRGLPTDRLVAEWWLDSPRVKQTLAGEVPQAVGERHSIRCAVAISETAAQVQRELRREFQAALAERFVVTGFERGKESGSYLLEKVSGL